MTFASGDDVQGRLSKIETEQKGLHVQVKRLRWIGLTTYQLGRASRFLFEKVCEAEFWKLFGMAVLLWVLKLLSPVLYHTALRMMEK